MYLHCRCRHFIVTTHSLFFLSFSYSKRNLQLLLLCGNKCSLLKTLTQGAEWSQFLLQSEQKVTATFYIPVQHVLRCRRPAVCRAAGVAHYRTASVRLEHCSDTVFSVPLLAPQPALDKLTSGNGHTCTMQTEFLLVRNSRM